MTPPAIAPRFTLDDDTASTGNGPEGDEGTPLDVVREADEVEIAEEEEEGVETERIHDISVPFATKNGVESMGTSEGGKVASISYQPAVTLTLSQVKLRTDGSMGNTVRVMRSRRCIDLR